MSSCSETLAAGRQDRRGAEAHLRKPLMSRSQGLVGSEGAHRRAGGATGSTCRVAGHLRAGLPDPRLPGGGRRDGGRGEGRRRARRRRQPPSAKLIAHTSNTATARIATMASPGARISTRIVRPTAIATSTRSVLSLTGAACGRSDGADGEAPRTHSARRAAPRRCDRPVSAPGSSLLRPARGWWRTAPA